MNRRDFIKTLSAIGVVAAIPSGVIPDVVDYPKIAYEVDYRVDMMVYIHHVSGRNPDGEKWVVIEYAEDKVLDDAHFLHMINRLSRELV